MIALECKRNCSRCGTPMFDFVADENTSELLKELLLREEEKYDFCAPCITPEELQGIRSPA